MGAVLLDPDAIVKILYIPDSPPFPRFRNIHRDREYGQPIGPCGEVERDLSEWNYPRIPMAQEWKSPFWMRFGDDLICWLVPVRPEGMREPTAWALHLATRPGSSIKIHARRFMTGLECIAEFNGLRRLVAAFPPDRTDLRDYCKRAGWCEDEATGFFYRDLGG